MKRLKLHVNLLPSLVLMVFIFFGTSSPSHCNTVLNNELLGGSNSFSFRNRVFVSYSFTIQNPYQSLSISINSSDFEPVLIAVSPAKKFIYGETNNEKRHNNYLFINADQSLVGPWELIVTSFNKFQTGGFYLELLADSYVYRQKLSDYAITHIGELDLYQGENGENAGVPSEPAPVYQSAPRPSYEISQSASTDPSRFPWPPPTASAMAILDNEVLIKSTDRTVHLKDIDIRLNYALAKKGYYDHTYYEIPDGFALVTRLEQIFENGSSISPPARWEIELRPIHNFDIHAIIRALFAVRYGYFRIIVFVVTSKPFTQSDDTVYRYEAIKWFQGGYNTLPEELGAKEYTKQHRATALIYEFEKPYGARNVFQSLPGRHQGQYHLEISGIFSALKE